MTEETVKYNITYSSDAIDDIDIIHDYISEKLFARQSAKRIIGRIRDQIKSLSMFPERHPLAPEERLTSLGLHKVAVENFVIYYEVDEKALTVTIARIVFGGRDTENIIHPEID